MKKQEKAVTGSRTPPLGNLEVEVLELLWASEPLSAKEAHARVGSARGISLHTVQSALDRLYKKELLAREKVGHAYRYRPLIERESLLAGLISDVFGRFQSDAAASAAAMLNAAEEMDPETLDWLEKQIRLRRNRGES